MKKTLSLVLCIALLLSIVPFGAVQAAAANGRIYPDQEVSVYCGSAGTWDVRTFIPEEDGIYIFSSSGSLDTLGYIALKEGEAQNENIQDDGGQGDNFAVTYEMTAGTTYYLGSTTLTGKGTYTLKVVKFEPDDGTIHPITLSQSTAVTTNKSKNIKFFSITPATSGKYIYLSSGNYDPQGYVFDEYWRQIAYSDVGGAAQNFQITLDLQAGQTYYIGYSVTSLTNATFNVLLYMSSYIQTISLVNGPSKDTYIKDIDATHVSGTTYHVDLILAGFEFKVNYSNGTSETRTYTYGIRGLVCDPSRDLWEGENDVRFSYMGNYSSFKINITGSPVNSLTMIQPPDKTVYYEEDMEEALDGTKIFNISLNGMILRAHYKNGTTEDFAIESVYGEEIDYFFFDHMIPASQMHLGDNTFTVSYYGAPMTFTVKYSLNSDNWQYEVNDGEVTLTKYIGTDTQALIPESLGDYPVTKIGDECFKDNTTLKSVKMTEQITTIGENAFFGCTALKELTLPSSLTSIGKQACYGLRKLEKLTWNAPNLSILKANNTFAYMGADLSTGTTVEFGFTCQAIPQDCFYNSSNTYAPRIYKIIVGENVATIGNNAFREIDSLRFVEWNAIQITNSIGTANNIWLNNAGQGPGTFEVHVGEYVQSLPNNLFYAATAARSPRITKMTVESNSTAISANTFRANSEVPLTFYCRYNEDSSANCVYNYCVANHLDYVLLDSPVDHIYLRSHLQKDEYIIGEDLDLTGLVVYAVYEDMTEQDVTEKIEVTGYDKTHIGLQQLTISYTFIDKTVTLPYEVLVTEEPLVLHYVEITSPAEQTEYYTGDFFNDSGLQLTAVFTDGTRQNVTDYMIISGYDMSTPGVQSVNVSYTYEGVTRSATYDILVKALVLTNLILHTAPAKTDYLVGEELNVDGLKVIAVYNSGGRLDVTNFCEFSGYDLNAKGAQTVSVSYTENAVTKTCSYGITVHNLLDHITIETLPTDLEFTVGSGFTARGIVVKATFENGVRDVSSEVTFSGYDMDTVGEQTVTVTYTDGESTKTATYNIRVNDKALLRLQLTSAPTANQYKDEALDTTGLNISAIYNDGSRENVASKCFLSGYNMGQTGAQTVTAAYTFGGKTLTVNFGITVLERTATGIEITTPASKTAYLVGEALDTSGIAVTLRFDDGSTKAVPTADLSFSGYNKKQAGEQTVTVGYTYKGSSFTATYTVTTTNYEVSIAVTAPTKTAYYYGDALETAGMTVTATMADGSTRALTSGYNLSGYDAHTLGTQTVSVTYPCAVTGAVLRDTFAVTVANFESAIAVSAPSKTDYFYGDNLDISGMTAIVTMADGSRHQAEPGDLQVNGYNPQQLGEQTVAVSYTGAKGDVLSDTFSVTVANFETAVDLTPPTKVTYYYGEALSLTGLSAKAVMADGSERDLTPEEYTLSAFDNTRPGSQTITLNIVGAKGDPISGSFTVNVVNYETTLTVTPPTKTSYFYGEALNTAGMSGTVRWADGSETVLLQEQMRVSGFNPQVLGEQAVTVAYTTVKGGTLQETFSVTVENFETALHITPPEKRDYYYGEGLESAGLSGVLTMADGSEQTAALTDLVVGAFDPLTTGMQTIPVSYVSAKGEVLGDSFTVMVVNYETALAVSAPTKTTYEYGEELDTAGMIAALTWADGSSTEAAPAALTVTGYSATQVGQQSISVSYTNVKGEVLSGSFTVTVTNYETGISVTPPARTEYYLGEELSTAGMVVKATMADGSQKTLSENEITLTGYDKDTLGEQTVTVSYTSSKGTFTDSFTVTVSNFATGLNVIPPTKVVYFYGESLNTSGISATLTSAAGESTPIDPSKLRYSGYNSRKLGEQTITVSFTSETGEVLKDTFVVIVNNYEKSITVTPPTKTDYYYGESLDTAGLGATALMADNSTMEVNPEALIVFGYSSTRLGSQNVSVMYKSAKNTTLSGSFTVTVSNYESALSIVTAPDKTNYYYGEDLDLTGLSANLVMANGATQAAESSALSIAAFNPQRLGRQTVTVNYTNVKGEVLSDTFTVMVSNYPTALTLSGDYPTEFTQGDSFESTGLKALAQYADGSRHDVSTAVTFSGYDMESIGTQTVTVTYSEGDKQVSASYEITVKKYESEKQRADVNEDGYIDFADVSIVIASANYGFNTAQAANARADADRNGVVNVNDVNLLLKAENYGQVVS
ncbi:MAG: bacterial Ig-like domain-containing protein [Clostridia bacterium]|nr:bacterial Ig-like domain-containing protein [Clostridia bacterium]